MPALSAVNFAACLNLTGPRLRCCGHLAPIMDFLLGLLRGRKSRQGRQRYVGMAAAAPCLQIRWI